MSLPLRFANLEKSAADDAKEENAPPEVLEQVSSEGSSFPYRLATKWKVAVVLTGLLVVVAVAAIGGVCGTGKCTSMRIVLDSNVASGKDPSSPSSVEQCPNATGPLRIGGRAIFANEIETIDVDLPPCGGDLMSRKAQGTWYIVVGGGEVLRASTCPADVLEQSIGEEQMTTPQSAFENLSDTKITVFDGANCEDFQCVAYNDQFCGDQSSVSWFAKKGHTYYLFVEGSTYEFSVAFEDNGECERAIGPIDTTGAVIAGSMRGRVPLNYTYFTCDITPTLGGQVWYWFKGTGSWMVASTCHPSTNFAARLDIYGQRECVLGTCVAPRDSDCGQGYQVVFKSEPDTDYRALVFKSSLILGIQFELSVKSFEPVHNDECEMATPLDIGTSVVGSTLEATFDFTTPSCGVLHQPGVWYKVTGTGGPLLASTCNNQTMYSSEISVYTGGCGETSLQCVFTTTQYCNEKASVHWESLADETYYIFVHGSTYGVFPNVGTFSLHVGPFEIEPNDTCEGATPLDNGGMLVGSTFNATLDLNIQQCTAFFSEAPGVWYSILGGDVDLRVSTCSPMSDFDTQITVYRGSCDSLACVNTDDSTCGLQSSVAWSAEAGSMYYILVHGRLRSSVGQFAITTEEYVPLVSNDFCDAAIEVNPSTTGSVVTGSTVGATFDNAGFCGAPNTAPGIWYKVQGTGRNWVASMCNDETNYNAALSVFEGDCVNLNCVDGNSDSGSCGLHPELNWVSKPNQDYWVLAHGYDTRDGEFSLELKEAESPVVNDYCVDAIPLTLSDDLISGSTTEASLDDAPICSALSQTHAGVWYTIEGTGKRFVISTCNSGEERVTNFDTVLSIFTGECGNLNCTLADDNFCGFQSKLVWLTEPGVTYYILVHGSEIGDFGLVLKEFVPSTANDFCAAAQGPLLPNGATYPGSTVGSSFDEAEICGGVSNTSPGVWFFMLGTGEVLTVDTCSEKTTFDTKLSIFSGRTCDDLVCVAGNDDACGLQSSISWKSEIGVFYWVLLHGWNTYGVGRFGLTVSGSELFE